jgi:hypothetical protein
MNDIEENDNLVHETLNMLEGQKQMDMNPSVSGSAGPSPMQPMQTMQPMPPAHQMHPSPNMQPDWNMNPVYAPDSMYGTPSTTRYDEVPQCRSIVKSRLGSILCMFLVVLLPLTKWILMILPMLVGRPILFSLALLFVVMVIYLIFMKVFDMIIPFWH